MNEYNLLLRSLMFVPGHNDRLIDSAFRSDADALLFDLEDSVQPIENKEVARQKIVSRLKAEKSKRYQIFPRVNDRESGQLLRDLYALTIDEVDGFVYPKSTSGKDVYFIDKLLETIECEKGYKPGRFKIIPLIETAGAVINVDDICKVSSRVVAVAFGCEDFVTDLCGVHDLGGLSLMAPRAQIAVAARANNVLPIDTVHIRVHDLGDLEKNLKVAKTLGFAGMLVLNPKEIPLVHRFFSPSEEEVSDAKEMLSLYEESVRENKGVAVKNGKFIGPPMVDAAKKVLAIEKLIKG